MGGNAMFIAMTRSKAKGATLLVLMALASYADEKGLCYPSVRVLARRARVSRTTALAAIDKLIASGELAMIPNGHVDRDRIRDQRRRGGFQETHYYQLKVVHWVDHLGGQAAERKVVQSTRSTDRRSLLLNKSVQNKSAAQRAAGVSREERFGLCLTVARNLLVQQPDISDEGLDAGIEDWARRRRCSTDRELLEDVIERARAERELATRKAVAL